MTLFYQCDSNMISPILSEWLVGEHVFGSHDSVIEAVIMLRCVFLQVNLHIFINELPPWGFIISLYILGLYKLGFIYLHVKVSSNDVFSNLD